MLRSGRPPRDKSELMIVNNYRGLEFMCEKLVAEDLSAPILLDLQRILTEGTQERPRRDWTVQSAG